MKKLVSMISVLALMLGASIGLASCSNGGDDDMSTMMTIVAIQQAQRSGKFNFKDKMVYGNGTGWTYHEPNPNGYTWDLRVFDYTDRDLTSISFDCKKGYCNSTDFKGHVWKPNSTITIEGFAYEGELRTRKPAVFKLKTGASLEDDVTFTYELK